MIFGLFIGFDTLQTGLHMTRPINCHSHSSALLIVFLLISTQLLHICLHECLLPGISIVARVRKYLWLNMIHRVPCRSPAAFQSLLYVGLN